MKTIFISILTLLGILSTQVAQAEPRCNVPTPDYPAVAKREWTQGVAVIDLAIATDGRVEQARVAKSTGSELLDNAAVAAARQAQCSTGPAETVTQPISFEMNRSYLR